MQPLAIDKPIAETKIVVAMSGGVDSSVVAAYLKDLGYQVIGITLQLYDHGIALEKKGACCAGQDIYDAKMVAEKIGIPHYVLNYESVFKEQVMEDFADSYLRGETPIPCVKCNQTVKFRDLLKVAKDLDADGLATGHYVQRKQGEKVVEMYRGADPAKDQSYFLFNTTQEQLDYLHFPLGGLHKEETRRLAAKYDLKVADKPDSTDICFVPEGGYSKVIERLRPGALDAGDIVDLEGNVLGRHEGIIHYTIGQRRGLRISSTDPLYVIRLDAKNKQVIVGPKSALAQADVYINALNWLSEEAIDEEGTLVEVKLRSTHQPTPATLYYDGDNKTARVMLHQPDYAVSPGQACVMYQGDRVLGGGWIIRKPTVALQSEAA